jgi:hypothetical protein
MCVGSLRKREGAFGPYRKMEVEVARRIGKIMLAFIERMKEVFQVV